MAHTSVEPFVGWGIASHDATSPEPFGAQPSDDANRPGQDQASYGEQSARLRHDMANILSVLQLRLYMVKKTHGFEDEEVVVFDQCVTQLRALLDCWKQLGAGSTHPAGGQIAVFDPYGGAAQFVPVRLRSRDQVVENG